jgi:hypothetical protein
MQVYIQIKEKQGLYNLNYGVIRLTQASMEKDCKICFHKNYPNVTEILFNEIHNSHLVMISQAAVVPHLQ